MNQISLKASTREGAGKKAAKALRREGKLPAVMYGARQDPVPLAVNYRDFDAFLRKHRGESAIINLDIEGDKPRMALLREVQRDYVQNTLIHVDFQQISLTDRIHMTLPLVLVGSAVGARPEHGGVLEQSLREIDIECLASDIPEHLEADISLLHLHESLHVGDLSFPGIRIITDRAVVIASVVGAMREAAPVEEAAIEPEIIARRAKDEA